MSRGRRRRQVRVQRGALTTSEHLKRAHVDHACVFGQAGFRDVASDGEAGIAELLIVLHVVAPGHGHVVHNPVVSTGRSMKRMWWPSSGGMMCITRRGDGEK